MEKTSKNQKPSKLLWLIEVSFMIITISILQPVKLQGQCLSSVNPVGGSDNLLALEKNSLRVITFYKFGGGNQYFEGAGHSTFNLIDRAYYNYISTVFGYGISNKLTIELESGYFINKTQDYNVELGYSLKGYGFSNFAAIIRHSLYSDQTNRLFITGGLGAKVPPKRTLQMVNYVKLPVEVQPTLGSYGVVFTSSMVKENSFNGMRYFLTTRMETNFSNIEDYKSGNVLFTSAFISKHLMYKWIKGDWTAIFQLKNEIRGYDKIKNIRKISSGSILFFAVPQINYSWREKWNISALADIPLYQHFNGTQLGAGLGASLIISRTFALSH